MPRPGVAAAAATATTLALALLGLVVVAEGLRCYVCNSKVDSRCADPIQLAEEDGGEDGDEGGSSSNNNNNKNKNHNNNHHSNSNNNNNNNNSNNKNPNHNNFNIDNNKNRFDEQNEGLQMVDCKVAQGVRQAMDAVSGLLNRLGQRAPGGGDVWAAVRASNLAAQSSQSDGVGPSGTSAGSSQSSGSSPSSTGSSGSSRPSSQYSSQGFPRQGGFSGQRGYDDHDLSAACHKVEMEVDGALVTDRGCAPGRVLGQEPCEALVAALGDAEFCELCDGDGCNAAPATAAPIATLILGIGLALQRGRPP